MEFKSEYYNETQIDSFIITYGFKDGKIQDKNIIKSNLNDHIYKNNNLIISFNPLDFGKLVKKILSSDKINQIEIFKDGSPVINFKDFKLSNNSFIRIINNRKYYFENNQQILFTKDIKTKFISNLPKSKNLVSHFIVLDIETFIKNNILTPYCKSIYDGKFTKSYYILDFNNS